MESLESELKVSFSLRVVQAMLLPFANSLRRHHHGP